MWALTRDHSARTRPFLRLSCAPTFVKLLHTQSRPRPFAFHFSRSATRGNLLQFVRLHTSSWEATLFDSLWPLLPFPLLWEDCKQTDNDPTPNPITVFIRLIAESRPNGARTAAASRSPLDGHERCAALCRRTRRWNESKLYFHSRN